jgi:2-polyprenyl-3-methyl-5-hydroxy-6-metoxy-1,4-benzoquinol methylase
MMETTRATSEGNSRLATSIDGSIQAPLREVSREAVFHYVHLLANGPGLGTPVRQALAATPAERGLDLGCGCGGFSLAVPGEYVGIDLDPRYIAFARRRFGDARRRFACMNLAELDRSETFDKAIMASVLHHLSDRDAHTVLGQLARMVRSRVVVMDLDPRLGKLVSATVDRQ